MVQYQEREADGGLLRTAKQLAPVDGHPAPR